MWSYIVLISPDVIGVNVFSMLDMVDLIRLESAAARRTDLDMAFRCTTLKHLHSPSSSSDEQQMRAWKWCVKKWLSIMDFTFEGEVKDGVLLSEVVRLVPTRGVVRWHCIVGWNDTYASIKGSGVLKRITHLRLSRRSYNYRLKELCSQMTSLEEAELSGEAFFEVLLSCRPLKTLAVSSVLTPHPLLAKVFAQHASTLQTFVAFSVAMDNDAYSAMATLSNLTNLHLHTPADEACTSEAMMQARITAIAKGCTKLECLSIFTATSVTVPSAVLLALATYCPYLREISLPVGLDDEMLVRLAENCPLLRTLSNVCWEVTSMAAVARAQSLLTRLTRFDVRCAASGSVQETNQTLAYALSKLVRAEALNLSGLSAAHGALLISFPVLKILRVFGLFWDADESLMLVAGAAGGVVDGCDGGLRRLTLRISDHRQPEGPNMGITDATLHLLAEHCPKLESINLFACPCFAEAAAPHLIQRCRNLRHIILPGTFGAEAKQRVAAALKQNRTTRR